MWGESLDKGSLTKSLEDQPEAENSDYDFSPNALRNSSAGIWGRMDSEVGFSKARALGQPV